MGGCIHASILKDYGVNMPYICLVFCWPWPGGWHVLWKRKGQRDKGTLILKYLIEIPTAHFYWGLNKISCRFALLFGSTNWRSYKRPSIYLSVWLFARILLWNCSQYFFCYFLHEVRLSSNLKRDGARFFEKEFVGFFWVFLQPKEAIIVLKWSFQI